MVESQRGLIRSVGDFGRCGKGARAVSAVRIVRQWIAGEQRRDAVVDWNGQRIHRNRVSGKSHDVDSLPLRLSRHGKYLRGSENLPEALILREIKCLAAAIVDARKEDRAAVGHAELIACKRRETPSVQIALVVKEISRVEGRIADKFEQAAVDLIAAGPRDHVRESRGAVTGVRGHDAGIGLHFLDGIDVEVGKGSSAEFRIGRVRSVDGENSGGAALAVDGKLLREIGGAIGVRHGAGGKEEELAEIAFI